MKKSYIEAGTEAKPELGLYSCCSWMKTPAGTQRAGKGSDGRKAGPRKTDCERGANVSITLLPILAWKQDWITLGCLNL